MNQSSTQVGAQASAQAPAQASECKLQTKQMVVDTIRSHYSSTAVHNYPEYLKRMAEEDVLKRVRCNDEFFDNAEVIHVYRDSDNLKPRRLSKMLAKVCADDEPRLNSFSLVMYPADDGYFVVVCYLWMNN